MQKINQPDANQPRTSQPEARRRQAHRSQAFERQSSPLAQLAASINRSVQVQRLKAMAEMMNFSAPVAQTTEREEEPPTQRQQFVIQRNKEASNSWTPEDENSRSLFFVAEHCAEDEDDLRDRAKEAHANRQYPQGFNTVVNMNAEDARFEIQKYLEDLDDNDSKNLANTEDILFTTASPYPYCNTRLNDNGEPEIEDSGAKHIKLRMKWVRSSRNHGYYQIYHLEAVCQ